MEMEMNTHTTPKQLLTNTTIPIPIPIVPTIIPIIPIIPIDYSSIYRYKICLGPMVRVNALPFRILALQYGCDLIFTEELIDQRLLKCNRIINKSLNTIDYITNTGNNKCVLLRIDMKLEVNKLILQLGTSDPGMALKAALLVQNDVTGIDINMGCPKKFSIQAGMGVALLDNPSVAYSIVKTLKAHLDIPVSVKMRLCSPNPNNKPKCNNNSSNNSNSSTTDIPPTTTTTASTASTVDDMITCTVSFMKGLIDSGVDAITIHMRSRYMSSSDDLAHPASVLREIITQLRSYQKELYYSSFNPNPTSNPNPNPSYVPILVNGDMYHPEYIHTYVQESMCDGVMLARPMLLNPSIARQLQSMELWKGRGSSNVGDIDSLSSNSNSSVGSVGNSGSSGITPNPPTVSPTLLPTPLLSPIPPIYAHINTQIVAIQSFLSVCRRYDPIFQVVKYTLQEMMLARRHPLSIMVCVCMCMYVYV